MFEWFSDLFSRRYSVGELARRLGLEQRELLSLKRDYREFRIRKKSGRDRIISAPNSSLKSVQRRILRRLLKKLKTHPQATGFQSGISFVDNARCHVCQAVVIRMDLMDFFPSTKAETVERYFQKIGWNRKTARLLTELTTWNGGLPQGAPTSPRLSNLVNYLLDTRLAALAEQQGAVYTRYADDITFSISDDRGQVAPMIKQAIHVIRSSGYEPHLKKKFDVRRQHQRQIVTGMVVNQKVSLPREKRRWLRAVEHRMKHSKRGGHLGSSPSLSEEQLRGWRSLLKMIDPVVFDGEQKKPSAN